MTTYWNEYPDAERWAYRQEAMRRRKAQRKAWNETRYGRLKRLPCLICGKEKVEGHHADYDQPLQVVWLCVEHHKQVHRMVPRLSPPPPRRCVSDQRETA